MNFQDKVVLVTGSSGGIGAATAIQFAKDGAKVVIVGRDETKLQLVREKIDKIGQKTLIIKADVSNDDDVRRIIAETVENFGRIDVLVNNAGMTDNVSILSDNFMEKYDHIIKLNLRGVVFITHLAIPHLIKSKGNIINISSVAGTRTLGVPLLTPYCVSKAGVDHFTRCTAMNLASYGVRVNAISPGPVRTDILDRQEVKLVTWDLLAETTALKRVNEPEEIADLILFLASDKAKSITGANFLADNGVLINTNGLRIICPVINKIKIHITCGFISSIHSFR